MGLTRCCIPRFLSTCRIQWPESTVLSLHINNVFAKKIIHAVRALMISQNIDLVAGVFNGAAWRCRSRDNLSSIDEAFANCALPTPPGHSPLWEPRSIPDNWADVCGFLKPTGSQRFLECQQTWRIFNTSTNSVCAPVIKAAIMRRGFICTSSTGATSGTIRLITSVAILAQELFRFK